MVQLGHKVMLIGLVMLASGLILPWLVGTLIPPWGYNILQLGGLGLAVAGWIVRTIGRRVKKPKG